MNVEQVMTDPDRRQKCPLSPSGALLYTLATILISHLIPSLPDSTLITVILQTYTIGRIETNALFIPHINLGLLCCLKCTSLISLLSFVLFALSKEGTDLQWSYKNKPREIKLNYASYKNRLNTICNLILYSNVLVC